MYIYIGSLSPPLWDGSYYSFFCWGGGVLIWSSDFAFQIAGNIMMVGRLLYCWEGNCSGSMLNFWCVDDLNESIKGSQLVMLFRQINFQISWHLISEKALALVNYFASGSILLIFDMGVSKNSGTPKSSILIGFSIINHPFWGTPIFGNTHMKGSKARQQTEWW